MSEWNTYLLGQIASDVREIKDKIELTLTWGQRLVILLMLWVSGVGINVAPDKLGDILAKLIR